VGTLLSGLLDQFLPASLMVRLLPRRAALGILLSGALGLVFPMCECGVVPVIRRLIRKGLPVSNAIAYMLAAPVVNPVVALSTYAAFRGQAAVEMTSLRLGLAFLVACLAAAAAHNLPLGKILRPGVADPGAPQPNGHGQGHGHAHAHAHGIPAKLRAAVGVAVTDFLDVMVFFVLGVAVSAVFSTSLNQDVLLPLALDVWLATASMMGLAFILSLCSTSDAFIAATFLSFPAVSKLAFLVFGPMFDLKLVFLYSSVFRKRFVLGLAIGLFLLIGLLCVRLSILGL
jgi:hypothetical protein